jgi:AcrR family transcriptional regulator
MQPLFVFSARRCFISPRPDVSEERKDQIIEAAIRIFAQKGFYETRMDDIVAESGLSKGTLYWYFKSKDDVIAAILEHFFGFELHEIEEALAREDRISDQLMLLMRRAAAELQHMAEIIPITLDFYSAAAHKKQVQISLKNYFVAYRKLLVGLIQRGLDRGEFRLVDPEETAIAIGALYEGLITLWVIDPASVDLSRHGEVVMQLLLDGLRAK